MSTALKVLDRELALQRAGGNFQLAQDLFKMLLDELPRYQQKLQDALAADDHEQLRHHAHKIAGSATYCGVPALRAAAESLEYMLKRGETETVADGARRLLHEIERVLEYA